MQRLTGETRTVPAVNQVELHYRDPEIGDASEDTRKLDVLDFELSPADVLRLSELGPEQSIGPDPDTFEGR